MTITVNDLDRDAKERVRSVILTGLFKNYSTLPTEEDKIDKVIQSSSVKSELETTLVRYYREFAERDVQLEISDSEYRQVYLHLL